MRLPIVTVPAPILRQKSTKVESITDEIKNLCDNMIETMYADKGCGLAAPQIGVSKSIFIMDYSKEQKEPKVYINPEIVWMSDNYVANQEGCLSFPGQYLSISRPEKIVLKYVNEKGEQFEDELESLASYCAQHEYDHLEGILFIDNLSKARQRFIIEKIQNIKQ